MSGRNGRKTKSKGDQMEPAALEIDKDILAKPDELPADGSDLI